MKELDLKTIKGEMEANGFYILRNYISESEINDAKALCDHLTDQYSEQGLLDRLFYKREESGNRQGDAVMVSLGENKKLPSLVIDSGLLEDHNQIISALTGKKVNKSSRSMMNMQQYFDKSLFVADHYDGWYSKFSHGEEDIHGECPLIIEEGLIPRYVQVVVLENKNNGRGVYVRKHNKTARESVELFPGDMLVFDNVNMRHGVPELEFPRRMLGFRNFDHHPKLFNNKVDHLSDWEVVYDKINPGYMKNITSAEAVKVQQEELKEWKNGKGEAQLKKKAAF